MPPFSVLHVCMGNICRSPMAEHLLTMAFTRRLTGDPGAAEELIYSHSAGTGGWHAGEKMNPPAAREIERRGGDASAFEARKLRSDHIDAADLILTATADQHEYVLALRPDAAARSFVLAEFGRLLATIPDDDLPEPGVTPEAVYARGVALVAAVDAARAGAESLPTDDLDDPWGRGDAAFVRIADEIEATVDPLAARLLPRR
ncbi:MULTISPECIES: arsenate reductase/protein-tyrosine-phosphatase family protein [Catenuloplanes]|uniref:protein-tyrosine-phosphatase n=1 Tax=Catenuloplanes niger TaxID=587534 RepID=A0AAE3ZRC0_9ACTN|nr:phosphotyrosine protein phosphatase [Catenuloplanes niger]MDR7324649.1 protein-tyrosine phosphatase [Catenuloplanes niger]